MNSTVVDQPVRQQLPGSWSLLSKCFELTKIHITNVIFLVLLPNLSTTLGTVYDKSHNLPAGHYSAVSLTLFGVGMLWFIINQAPTIMFAVRAAQGKSLSLADCYRQGLPFIWRVLAMDLLFVGAILLGFLLLLIPGFIVLFLITRRYYLTGYYLVDQNLGLKAALARCRLESVPYSGYVWGVIGVQIALTLVASIVGALNVYVGVLASVLVLALTSFLAAIRYQQIATPADISLPAAAPVRR